MIEVAVLGRFDGTGYADLSVELAHAKAALLYGDVVRIESPRPSFLVGGFLRVFRSMPARADTLDDAQRRAEARKWLAAIEKSWSPGLVAALGPTLEALRSGDPRPLLRLPDTFAEGLRGLPPIEGRRLYRKWSEVAIASWVKGEPDERGAEAVRTVAELNRLIDADVVEVSAADAADLMTAPRESIDETVDAMVSRLVAGVADSAAYPVVPASANVALRATSDLRKAQAKRAALAAYVIGSIPNLAHVPADELLDIRGAVAPHTARFRAAIADLADTIDTDLGDEEFVDALEEVRVREVEPAMEELNETLRDTAFGLTIAKRLPFGVPGAVGLGVSTQMGGPAMVKAIAAATAIGGMAAKEVVERHEAAKERRKHRLFLLFDVQRRITAT